MKRLRDTEPDSPLAAQARSLLEAVEPLPDDAARMQRVRRALDADAGRGAAVQRWPALGLAMVIGLFGASAFAAVRFVAEWRGEPAELQPERSAPATDGRRASKRKPSTPEAATDAPATPLAAEPAQESAVKSARRAPRRTAERGEQAPTESAPSADSAADSPHSALVHEALQALRHQNEPARAARLLQEYAQRAPGGSLAEEALSLRVEALQALHDPRARVLASQYLERYPAGRYAAVARRALADAAP